MSRTILRTPAARCRFGLATADITPPPDAYHRNWGAALSDAAEGIHRPLRATAALFQPESGGPEHLLVALDLGWLRLREMDRLLERLQTRTGVDLDRLVVTFSHTHSAINLDLTRTAEAGGRHILPYLEELPGRIAAAVEVARQNLRPADLTFGRGHCSLAMHRDYWDAERQLWTCGPDPEGPTDDALWVIRCADRSGRPLAYLVNYACHPTTLAWTNRLISPDYVGALRELVEAATGVPCLFVLGACGDLGPRDGFVGDPGVADRNGRQLGYAVLQVVESLSPSGTEMHYLGPVVSGATLGIWEHRPFAAERLPVLETFRSACLKLALPCRPLPSPTEVERELQEWQRKEERARAAGLAGEMRDCRAQVERRRRLQRRLEELPADGREDYQVRIWQLGEGVLVMVNGEPYNGFQQEVRAHFPETPILVAVLCNRPQSYILPKNRCGLGLYQEECSTLAPGALERIVEAVVDQLRAWNLS